MLAKNKKGISEIVVTIIIILLAIVVFAVVSVVVRGTVSKGAENIELSANCLEVEMHATKIAQTMTGELQAMPVPGSYDVTVSRSGAGKELDGVKIMVEDAEGENSVSSGDLELGGKIKPLDKRTYAVSGFGEFVPTNANVKVIPFFMKKSGERFYCDESAQTDELAVSTA